MAMNRSAALPRPALTVLLVAGCLFVAGAAAVTGGDARRLLVENGLGRTPQMG